LEALSGLLSYLILGVSFYHFYSIDWRKFSEVKPSKSKTAIKRVISVTLMREAGFSVSLSELRIQTEQGDQMLL
jgi:hypothetical protein